MNKKIDYSDILTELVLGALNSILCFAIFFFLVNIAWFLILRNAAESLTLVPTLTMIAPAIYGAIIGYWLGHGTVGANIYHRRVAVIVGTIIGALLGMYAYNTLTAIWVQIPIGSFDMASFISSFIIGISIGSAKQYQETKEAVEMGKQ